MFLTKLKLGTSAVLCACLIGGSVTSLGIAQDAKPKPAVGRLLDKDFKELSPVEITSSAAEEVAASTHD